ncbi:MAG: class I tRNA ligase family protein, partial [Patescibacteria group bacterium]
KQIVIDGFVTGEGGIKMSKSLGNAVDPLEIVKEYGTDALRYYVLRELHPFEDSEFTLEKFKSAYNANLANGLGNLVSRILKMTSSYGVVPENNVYEEEKELTKDYHTHLEHYEINKAADEIWKLITGLDLAIQREQPFKTIKTDEIKTKEFLRYCLGRLFVIAHMLAPMMPKTALVIKDAVKKNISLKTPLFPRKP